MNKKGFTLVELLATIVILGVVMGIASYSVINAINTSKLKSEKIFIDKLSNLIDDYLDLYPPTNTIGDTYTFAKCMDKACNDRYETTAIQMQKIDEVGNTTDIYFSDLINKDIATYSDLINPKNKEQCFNNFFNPRIIVYKDSDYVYHYYVDLRDTNTNCDITDENAIINTLPTELSIEVGLS